MRYQKGSYTVEAALLMGIILSVLLAILFLIFFFHDRGFLQGAAHETACIASLHADDEKKYNPKPDEMVKGRMLWTRAVSGSVGGDKKVTVHYQGAFRIPQMAAVFFGTDSLNMEGKVTLTVQRPSRLIQRLRGAVKIVNRVRGDK